MSEITFFLCGILFLFRCEQTFVSGLLVRTNSDERSGATDTQTESYATVTFSSFLARHGNVSVSTSQKVSSSSQSQIPEVVLPAKSPSTSASRFPSLNRLNCPEV